MSPESANAVYDILVDIAGANIKTRPDFVHEMTRENPTIEWRFGGYLGFGGKYYRERNKVSCYREDETLVALKAMADTNEALARLDIH